MPLQAQIGEPLTDGPTLDCAPHHLRMSCVLRAGDSYYLYADFIEADDPYAPSSYSSELHLFTSPDLKTWTHSGPAVTRRAGKPDAFGCVNVDTLHWEGRFYLYYTGLAGPAPQPVREDSDTPRGWLAERDDPLFLEATILVAVSDSPEGPFDERHELLTAGPPASWESMKVLDPHVCRFGDKFLMTYKGFSRPLDFTTRRIGLAVADSPLGPFRKYEGNPVLTLPGGVECPKVFALGNTPLSPACQTTGHLPLATRHSEHGPQAALGMFLLGFEPRRWILLSSPNGIDWAVTQDPVLAETSYGRGDCDIGLVKDENNRLLPYFFQCQETNPRTLRGYGLRIRGGAGVKP